MRDIYTHREEKDALFTNPNSSPLNPYQLANFSGLDYFRNDSRYVVQATVTIFEAPKVVSLETSQGGTVAWGCRQLPGDRLAG